MRLLSSIFEKSSVFQSFIVRSSELVAMTFKTELKKIEVTVSKCDFKEWRVLNVGPLSVPVIVSSCQYLFIETAEDSLLAELKL